MEIAEMTAIQSVSPAFVTFLQIPGDVLAKCAAHQWSWAYATYDSRPPESEDCFMPAITAALFVAMFLLVSHSQGALHGYLDPGTGSIAVQLVIGGLVAALATIRLYWQRLKTGLRRTPVEHEAAPESH
jgi:hypothetical protein